MRKNIKYFTAGFLTASLLAAAPALADRIDAFMNMARINIDGVDRLSWGEEMELDNGFIAPSSINYKDTLYLPMRKISELSGNEVFWNGDSRTAYVVDRLQNRKVIAEREDIDGNLWEYATAQTLDGASYLTATDGYRGYTRIYRMPSTSVRVTDDAIYFMRLKEHDAIQNQGTIIKLSYANDTDTQDGEALISLYPVKDGEVFFEGDYVFYAGKTPGNGTHARLTAYNYMTNEEVRYEGETQSDISGLTKASGDGIKTVVEYTYTRENGNSYRMRTTFDSRTKKFSQGEIVVSE